MLRITNGVDEFLERSFAPILKGENGDHAPTSGDDRTSKQFDLSRSFSTN